MSDTTPKPFVFVLMPFDEEFDDVYVLGIKRACIDAGAYAERVDEQIFKESILQRIYNQIAKADVIVADMTGRNPNVFYEVGYAHALGKHVILLTQKSEDIPFDLKHYPHIVYGGKITDLIPELERRVKWAIKVSRKKPPQPILPIEFYVMRTSLSTRPRFKVPLSTLWHSARKDRQSVSIKIDCCNPDDADIGSVYFDVAFVTSERLDKSIGGDQIPSKVAALPGGGFMHLPRVGSFRIQPGAWESFEIRFLTQINQLLDVGDTETVTLRAFSEDGKRDYPFTVEVVTDST